MRSTAVAALLVLAALPRPVDAAPRPRLAVLDLRSVQGVAAGTASILTAIVVSDATRAGYDVISQADIGAMIGFEKQKQMLGCSDQASCLAEIGGALGVDRVLSGQVGQIGSRYHLSLQLLDSRKARVIARAARFSERNEDDLAAAAEGALAELLGAVPAGAAPPAAAASPVPAPPAASSAAPAGPALKASPVPLAPPDLSRPPEAARAASAVPQLPRAGFRPSRGLAWATLGGGVALVATGLAAGAAARGKYSDLKAGWQDPNYQALYDAKSRDIRTFSIMADVLTGTGAVATGVGIWFLVRSGDDRMTVAPSVARGRVGLVATGRF